MIGPFRGYYAFLSNFFPCSVEFAGDVYPSAEHAYQAAKTMSDRHREQIRGLKSAGMAKRFGRTVPIRPGWEKIKLRKMHEIVKSKFRGNPDLQRRLLRTGPEELVEVNNWRDTFWGVCDGRGENHLGRILMQVRDGLIDGGQQ